MSAARLEPQAPCVRWTHARSAWANNLVCGGFPNQCSGAGCTGGELSGLFVTDLGNKANESVLN